MRNCLILQKLTLFVMAQLASQHGVPLDLDNATRAPELEEFFESDYAEAVAREARPKEQKFESWEQKFEKWATLALDPEMWQVMRETEFVQSANTADSKANFGYWKPGGYGCQPEQGVDMAWAGFWAARFFFSPSILLALQQPPANHMPRELDGWYGPELRELYDLFPGQISKQHFEELKQMRPGSKGDKWAE